MAGFCSRCGRQLQDGEVCNCNIQQAVPNGAPVNNIPQQTFPNGNQMNNIPPNMMYNQQMGGNVNSSEAAEAIKQIFNKAIGVFSNPYKKSVELAEENNMINGIGMISIHLISMIIFVLIWGAEVGGKGIPFGEIILYTIIIQAVCYFGWAGCLFVGAKYGFGVADATFDKLVSILGARSIWDAAVMLAGGILWFIADGKFSALIFLVGWLGGILISFISTIDSIRLDTMKTIYLFIMTYAIMTFIQYELLTMFLKNIAGSFFSSALRFY